MKTYKRVLTIAGSDSGGGAGIQADLKTFSALGCYGMSVITALTAQNTTEVTGIHPVPIDFIKKQLHAVFSDIGVDAVKIGMLFSKEIIEAVSDVLNEYKPKNIVLDPVMIAKSGDKLLEDDAIQVLKEKLIPLAAIVTPNLPEANCLADSKSEDLELLTLEIQKLGSQAVLLKGGHLEDKLAKDFLLLQDGSSFNYESERITTPNTHGTGCTFSSAIAAFLARGETIPDAVGKAKQYLTEAIQAGSQYGIGQGHGPVCHFWEKLGI